MTIHADEFFDAEAKKAIKAIDFYEGRQMGYLIQAMNGDDGEYGARGDWQDRGFVPRVRNIFKPIVEKSANLFNKPPTYEILTSPTAAPTVDPTFNDILAECDFHEYERVLDIYTRFLKSTCTLQGRYTPDDVATQDGIYRYSKDRGDSMVPMLLHRGNTVVKMNEARTVILELGYITKAPTKKDATWQYRYINPEYSELRDVQTKTEEVVPGSRQDNPYGIVNATMHYDAGKPRTGVWAPVPEDLISFQMQYNLHLTDLDFALAQGKSSNLVVVNGRFAKGKTPPPSAAAPAVVETAPTTGSNAFVKGYRMGGPDNETPAMGIGATLYLDSPANKKDAKPEAAYISPNADVAGHDEVMRRLIDDLASDWCVKLKTGGSGAASSGFQLMVEEIDNLTLREQRALAFQASLRRFYRVTQVLYPELTKGELQVIFAEPSLPVNQKEQVELWQLKITNGFASIVDYFMDEEGYSLEEALVRADEVKKYNELYNPQPIEEEGAVSEEKAPAKTSDSV